MTHRQKADVCFISNVIVIFQLNIFFCFNRNTRTTPFNPTKMSTKRKAEDQEEVTKKAKKVEEVVAEEEVNK